jgi:transposase
MVKKQLQRTLSSDKEIDVENKLSIVHKKKIVFKTYTQNQNFLLPKSIDDFVTPGHIARFVSTIIDNMNIDFIIETYKGGGTSSYNPKMLLKVWILGFIDRIYTSRILAKQLRENLTFIWISGNQQPNFRTLNNFRLRLKNDIKLIFKQIVRYGLETGIIKGEDVFIDHTKKAANSNKHKVVWRKNVENQLEKIDEELDKLFEYIDMINEDDEKHFGDRDLPEQEPDGFDDEKVRKIVKKVNDMIKKGKLSTEEGCEARRKARRTKELIEREKKYKMKKDILGARNSYSKTDTDAVAMRMKDKLTTRPAYNEGIATENGFVLNYDISDNAADNISFIPLMNGIIDNLGKIPENALSDSAYGTEENHNFIEGKGIKNFLKYNTYHKEKSKKWRKKRLRLQDFIYDEKKDGFTCPNNVKLRFQERRKEKSTTGYIREITIYKAEEGRCLDCQFRNICTEAQTKSLQVSWKAERLKKIAKENLDSAKGKKLRKRRGNEVESVFGDGKMNKVKQRYVLRGLEKVNIEAGIQYISHNIRKIYAFLSAKVITKSNHFSKENI